MPSSQNVYILQRIPCCFFFNTQVSWTIHTQVFLIGFWHFMVIFLLATSFSSVKHLDLLLETSKADRLFMAIISISAHQWEERQTQRKGIQRKPVWNVERNIWIRLVLSHMTGASLLSSWTESGSVASQTEGFPSLPTWENTHFIYILTKEYLSCLSISQEAHKVQWDWRIMWPNSLGFATYS